MQMIKFRDDAAVALSGKWQIRLLSRASFTLAPGHRAVLIVEPCIILGFSVDLVSAEFTEWPLAVRLSESLNVFDVDNIGNHLFTLKCISLEVFDINGWHAACLYVEVCHF